MVFGKINDKAIVELLKKNPTIILKMSNKIGASKFRYIMKFLGINPFTSATNKGKFIGILKNVLRKDALLASVGLMRYVQRRRNLGTAYNFINHMEDMDGTCICLSERKKISGIHVEITKKTWDYLSKIMR